MGRVRSEAVRSEGVMVTPGIVRGGELGRAIAGGMP